ncbi:hypothetical protein KL933_003449 [Ogataea haglerorum]|uniref:Uncharacterized protein n=1 Tax=Ogataea haglerorum TaxID=1937702 RepID=A0AAN6D4N0_9ASCO|nr:hypothetical protein KL933_003449 [Ogataea haglerorum]
MQHYKLVKHAPPLRYSYNDSRTVVHIKSSTPFMSAAKRILKNIDYFDHKYTKKGKPIPNQNKLVSYIVVRGMGKAISKVTNLALYFDHELGYKVEVFTKTVEVLDELQSANDDDVYQRRKVSCLELHIDLQKKEPQSES